MKTDGRPILLILLTLAAATAWADDDAARQRRRTPTVEVFERCRDAVVNVSTTRLVRVRSLGLSPFDDFFNRDFFDVFPRPRDRQVQSVGSGAIVHAGGYVVTNAHVVSQASDIKIIFADGRTEPAEIVAVDAEHDLAVLKLDVKEPLSCVPLGRSDDLMIGETVVAIGNPLGFQHTVTSGIISALNRDLDINGKSGYRKLIQTDASINPGNSGGPLLNINAELIGINTAIRGDAQNIGFAIPVDRLWELLPVMLDIERHQRVRFGLRVAGDEARVLEVKSGTPAAEAGLQRNDRIVRFNGERIENGIDYYVHLLNQKAGDQIRLALMRNGQTLEKEVSIEAIPPPDGAALARRLLGLTLEPVPARVRNAFDLPEHVGLMVSEVEPRSPADQVGMQPGDLILRLDRVPARDVLSVGLVLEQVEAGQRLMVEGLRVTTEPAFAWTVSIPTRRGI